MDDPKLQMARRIAADTVRPSAPGTAARVLRGECDDWHGVKSALAAIEECTAMLPDEIDLFRIIRAAGRSNIQKARAVADHLKGPTA